MKRRTWFIIGHISSLASSLLLNIVASYFPINTTIRLIIVVLLFLLFEAISTSIIVKKLPPDASKSSPINVIQQLKTNEVGGKLNGLDVDALSDGAEVKVNQKVKRNSGEITGIRLRQLDENDK